MLGYARAITALVPAQLWSVRIIRECGQTGDRILEIGASDRSSVENLKNLVKFLGCY